MHEPGLPDTEPQSVVAPLFGLNCSQCGSLCSGLLRRAGVSATFFAPSIAVLSPRQELAELSNSSPKLAELKRAYAALPWPVLQRSQWTQEYVARDVNFQNFRGDCAYVWQRRDMNAPASYVLTAYYLLAGPTSFLLRRLTEDGLFGAYLVRLDDSILLSRDLLDSVNELAFLERNAVVHDRRPLTILDIGSGYGRFAHRVHEAYGGLHRVICLDAIAESTFICEYYLRSRGLPEGYVIPLPAANEALRATPADAAVSIHVLSECTLAAIGWWLDLLSANAVRYLFIVPNADWHGGSRLLSTEMDGSRIPFEGVIHSRGYRLIADERKYGNDQVQRFGVTPTHYFLYEHRD